MRLIEHTVGITQYTQKGHIARATLEATCYQTKAILDAMKKDSGHALSELAVDGGVSNSDLTMQVSFFNTYLFCFKVAGNLTKIQIQADLISIPVYRPKMRETTALGAAIAAGMAVGLWHNFTELRDINRAGGVVFEPSVSREKSAEMFSLWEKAVHMSEGWIEKKEPPNAINIKQLRKPSVIINGKSMEPTSQSVFDDLNDADEEDLLLELRKIEIQQALKRLRKAKA